MLNRNVAVKYTLPKHSHSDNYGDNSPIPDRLLPHNFRFFQPSQLFHSICMISPFLFVSVVREACHNKMSNLHSPVIHTQDCLQISASLFSGIGPSDASVITAARGSLTIRTSTFHQRYTSGLVYGSAISKTGIGLLTVEFCCILECSSTSLGLAIYINSPTGAQLGMTSLHACGKDAQFTGRGTICQGSQMQQSTYTSLNFSSCTLSPRGDTASGFEASGNRTFTFSYCIFEGGHAGRVIHDSGSPPDVCDIKHCHFLSSTVGVAVLDADLRGMNVSNCVFSGETSYDPTIFRLGKSDSRQPFMFLGCVVPSPLGNGGWAVVSGETAYTGRTSLFVALFGTGFCATPTGFVGPRRFLSVDTAEAPPCENLT